jgi:L-ascorbate metabolism protein UlaG (beta-lactamase superfamily)
LDWWERKEVFEGIELIATPARHFSGRSFVRNKTLWSSFVLRTEQHSIYIGSDSGYDSHFKVIGEKYGPFDIGILECGQYNEWWPFIHMMPEETVLAAIDLKAKLLMPVHWGKFALGLHPWDEPINRAVARAQELGVSCTTPMIGEPVVLGETLPAKAWWKKW